MTDRSQARTVQSARTSTMPAERLYTRHRRRSLPFALAAVLVSAAVSCALPAHAQSASDIYVAATGSDSTGTGTINAPYKTLEKARQYIRSTGRNVNMTQDLQVWLRGGTYPLASAQNFDSGDSGSNGHLVHYTSYPNEMATFTGGKQITGWTLYDSTKNIYKASAQGLNFRQLYINGARATRARFPNKTSDSDFGPYSTMINWDNTGKTLSINAADVSTSWSGLTSTVEMVVKNHFDVARLPIASVNVSGSTATVTPQTTQRNIAFDPATVGVYHAPGQSYYFENSYSFLDQPGEWFLDKAANVVYYIPRPGETMSSATVTAPVTEDLLDIHGASNVSFEWLTFQYAGWIVPAAQMIGLQSGLVFNGTGGWNSTAVPGAIRISGSSNLTLNRITVCHVGAAGINISDTTNHVAVQYGQIYDIGSVGIWDDPGLINNAPGSSARTLNDEISNCVIHDVGKDYTGAAGIVAGFPDGLKVLHNEIYNSPYTGITVGLGSSAAATSLQNNIISYNNVHDVMQLHDDNGGIYTQSLQPGTQITYNWVHHVKRAPWAEVSQVADVYLDNSTGQVTVAHNVLESGTVGKKVHTQTDAKNNAIYDNEAFAPTVVSQAGPPSGTFATASIPVPSAGPHTNSPGDTLQSGSYLRVGQYLEGGSYFCTMQGDGNLVIYKGSGPSNNQGWAWDTGSGGRPVGNYFATVNYHGRLQIFAGTPENPGLLIWQSNPYATIPNNGGSPYFVHMQGDGNLVLLANYGYNDNSGNSSAGYWDRINGSGTVLANTASNVPVGKWISLLASANNNYVTADLNQANLPLVAEAAAPHQWESFYVEDNGNNNVALRAAANNRYVGTDYGLTGTAYATLDTGWSFPYDWTSYTWANLGGATASLRATNGQYVCADLGLVNPPKLVANRTSVGQWETFTAVSQTSLPVSGSTYKVTSQLNGYGLNIYGANGNNGAPVAEWPYGGGTNEKWVFTNLGGNLYKITSTMNGKALEIAGANSAVGGLVQMYDWLGGTNPQQQWYVWPNADGSYTITNANSTKALEVPNDRADYSNLVQLWQNDAALFKGGQNWLIQAP